jgi:hypothetical protein
MSEEWKNSRMEADIRQHETEMMENAALKKKEKRTAEWLEIYEKCKDATDSPSITRGLIQWFIDNNYETPKQV